MGTIPGSQCTCGSAGYWLGGGWIGARVGRRVGSTPNHPGADGSEPVADRRCRSGPNEAAAEVGRTIDSSGMPPPDLVLTLFRVTWHAAARSAGMPIMLARLADSLASNASLGRVLVADPFRSLPRLVARTCFNNERRVAATPSLVHCRPVRLRACDPFGVRALERSYRAYDATLRRCAMRAGMNRPAVLTLNPFVAAFAPLTWAGDVTFHAFDDMGAHPTYVGWETIFDETYKRIRESGRAVSAVSEPIISRIRPTGRSLVAPNGVDVAEWRHPGTAPAWFLELPRPRLLYVGTLDGRLDVDLVLAVAARIGEGSINLVGPTMDEPHLRRLRTARNVRIHPPVDRGTVVAITAAADVCLVPHVRNALTIAMSPLKLYEALAAGTPVAAVDLPPMRDVDPRVVLAADESPASFSAAVLRALSIGRMPEIERLNFIVKHSWSRQHEDLLGLALRNLGRH